MKKRRFRNNPFHERVPRELAEAAKKAAQHFLHPVLIGGMALTFHFPTYPTDDVDFGVYEEKEVPQKIDGMKRLSPHVFETKDGVIVDVVTPGHVKVPVAVFHAALDTAVLDSILNEPISIATPLALFAIKLCRSRIKDQAHLMWMMRHNFLPTEQALLEIGVPVEKMILLRHLQAELAQEEADEKEMGW